MYIGLIVKYGHFVVFMLFILIFIFVSILGSFLFFTEPFRDRPLILSLPGELSM